MDNRVSQKDVAKKANVSVITASRAIRGVGRVNPETRRRVLEAAAALGYERHTGQVFTAFGNSSASEHTLRVILPLFKSNKTSANTVFGSKIVQGVEDVLAKTGGRLVPIEADDIDDLLKKMPRTRIHGIILRQVLPIRWLRKLQHYAPVVYAISHDVQPGVDCVHFNEFKSTAMIYDHLLGLGHRRFAWIYSDRSNPHASVGELNYDRHSGFDRQAHNFSYARFASWHVVDLGTRDNLTSHQYITIPLQLKDDPKELDPEKTAQEAARRFLALTERPTAVVVYSDDVAHFLLKELADADIHVPDDISMLTYLSSDFGLRVRSQVSGIRLPFSEVGQLIPELIQRRISQPDAHYISVALETELVNRGSAAQAPTTQ